jgi:uncharacterized membrane protein YjjP (DUF1212 family)
MNPIRTALAALAVVLVAAAVAAMATGEFMAAGLSFLSASLVLYLRETRFRDDDAE